MTQQEWTRRHRKVIDSLVKNNNPLKIAARTAHQNMTDRIFVQGKSMSGADIGAYDTKKGFYVNPNLAPRAGRSAIKGIKGLKPTKGKTGKSKFKNGNSHKTTFVKSYKDFRDRMGRKTDRVNLVLSGDLQSDFANARIVSDRPVKNAAPTKVSVNEYRVGLSRDFNQDKMAGMENRFRKKIFRHSAAERAKFYKIADLELRNEFVKAGLK